MDIRKENKFSDSKLNDTKSLFLGDATVSEIVEAIKNQKHKGRLKGELKKYIQNWEYYPNCNAVNFLCKPVLNGNLAFFTQRITKVIEKYHLTCSSSSSDPIRNYFLLGKENNGIRFLLNENNIGSFIVYHWIEEPTSES